MRRVKGITRLGVPDDSGAILGAGVNEGSTRREGASDVVLEVDGATVSRHYQISKPLTH